MVREKGALMPCVKRHFSSFLFFCLEPVLVNISVSSGN
jgi:hypothetical protein